jgi:hypothetical protein
VQACTRGPNPTQRLSSTQTLQALQTLSEAAQQLAPTNQLT